MLDMSKYAGVQNPQLYQEILDKERKRQQNARPPDRQTQQRPSEFSRAAEKLRAYAAKSSTPSSSTYKTGQPSGSARAPKPSKSSSYTDAEASKEKQSFQLPGVKDYEDTFVYDNDTYRLVKMPVYEDEYLEKLKQDQQKPKKEPTEEEIIEQIMRTYHSMQNASSTNQYTYYHNWLFDPESFLRGKRMS